MERNLSVHSSSSKGFLLFLTIALIVSVIFIWVPEKAIASTNLAFGKTITANNCAQSHVATNANDGNVSTYWKGAANSYPDTLTIDLGSSHCIGSMVLKLNPTWGLRTQTLQVLGRLKNSTYKSIANSATYTFNPTSSNVVTINFTPITARYIRLSFTANSAATGGQLAEFEVYSSAGSTPTPTITPTSFLGWAANMEQRFLSFM
jgi:hypothetical protein